ncbi:MAG: alanine dehydrogenase [Deltaproteobacteria bacterium]|nr:alanine dehydrogenase [Deltaproteobacteria bacterium]
MIIGVPKEIKTGENRVAMTPQGLRELKGEGHTILVEKGAGAGAGFSDRSYAEAGGEISSAGDVWERAVLISKVKEPLPEEYPLLKEGHTLFTFLHLAADYELTKVLLEKKITAVAYETVTDLRGNLPLLRPMSAVAGALSIQAGATGLEKQRGGRGILLPGIAETKPATVTIVGAGISGSMAARVASGMGADVTVLDIVSEKLERIRDITMQRAKTLLSAPEPLAREAARSDLLILTVLIPGRSAPRLIKEEMVSAMKPGACIVDISIDQGGAAETSRPTTLKDPYFVTRGVVHYCVTNMPSAVPLTSTWALTSATLPYIKKIASSGINTCLREDPGIKDGLNTYMGNITCRGVAESFSEEYVPFEKIS